MINKLKNWWATIALALGYILDMEFGVFSPLFDALGIPENTANTIKIVFGIAVLIKQKLAAPSQNPDKLQKLADKKRFADDGDGSVQPGKGL